MSTLLATPSCGWSHLSFPNFDTPLSYIDDVALLLLQDFILVYLDKQVAAVTFDCEGYDTTLVLSNYDLYGIQTNTEPASFTHILDDHVREFLHQLVTNIETDLDKWASFSVFETDKETYEKETAKNKTRLQALIKEIKEHPNYG